MVIKRAIQDQIEKRFFKGKAIIIYGARRVGKTTLIKEIQKKYSTNSVYYNCDEPDIREMFTDVTSTELKLLLGSKRIIFLDEAQRVKNIGISLKLLVDNYPHSQIIATGSSSFDLSNEAVEPLTGRKYEFFLHTFSFEELGAIYSPLELKRTLERRILFGIYPEVVFNEVEAENIIKEISRSYLFKDVLQYQQIKNPELLEKLLQALALQIANEVSYNELANLLGIDKKTVAHYIELLEKSFVIFRLRPFSRNLRQELTKLRKIYFYDTGIRNALINNFNPFSLRQDVSNLWENFLIAERAKHNNNHCLDKRLFFWRTHQQQEIDYLEEEKGAMSGFEFKWKKEKFRAPAVFLKSYPKSKVVLVNQNNWQDFATGK